jgi:hypothetical protein
MDFSEYQRIAGKTSQAKVEVDENGLPVGPGILVPLLGLAGEVGSLLSEYKKHLRDGKAHRLFREQVSEELGDLIWYVADAATRFGLDLDHIAAENLAKTQDRWSIEIPRQLKLFDEDCPPDEQLPRHFEVELRQKGEDENVTVECWWNGQVIGNTLTDNAYLDDGYRFHDAFHFAFAAILGWSPIARTFFGCKRRSRPKTDEVEDSGRARVIEECISALIYDYARKHDYLSEVSGLDYPLLKLIKAMVADREVRAHPLYNWEQAILEGYRVWRLVRQNGGGIVIGDLSLRTIAFRAT